VKIQARWVVGIINTKAMESDSMKETNNAKTESRTPIRMNTGNDRRSASPIGPVRALVVARVIHGCSCEVIRVNIMRPIGVDAWH